MHAAPWWIASAKRLLPGGAFLLVLVPAAALLGGCMPEYDAEGYSMSAVTRAHRTQSAAVRPPACDSQSNTAVAAASDVEVRTALEYERACYKQAEAKVRARLNKLQHAAARTHRIVSAPARPPTCDSSSNASAATATEPQEKSGAFLHRTSSGTHASNITGPNDRRRLASAAMPSATDARDAKPSTSELEVRIALEYERACYKQAEANVRARLNKLQQVVSARSHRRSGVQSANLEAASP
jgi:hypothetical protein